MDPLETQDPVTEDQEKGGSSPQKDADPAREDDPGEGSVPTGAEENPAIAGDQAPPVEEGKEEETPPEETPAADPRDARIAELEARIAAAGTEYQAALAEAQAHLTGELAKASNHYKTLALAGNPDIPAELVEGNTIEAVQASIEKAKAVVQKVKDQLAAQAAGQVPGGGQVRTGADVEGMSATEKIQYALRQRR